MPRSSRSSATVLTPLFTWQMLGLRLAETMVASSHVISHRTNRSNTAAQLFEMGSEKVQAAMESTHAMARHWMKVASRDPLAVWSAWPQLLTSGFAPFHARATQNARRIRRVR
jgi:hypothetical protein